MDNNEVWLPVPEYVYLEASSLGRIRTLTRPTAPSSSGKPNFRAFTAGKVLAQTIANNGYLRVDFRMYGRLHRKAAHRLIASAFVPGYFQGASVDHIDGNRLNNTPSNLRWLSLAENSRLQNADGRGAPKGELHPCAKLTNREVIEILDLFMWGMSRPKIAKSYGVSVSLIYRIAQGNRRKIAHG